MAAKKKKVAKKTEKKTQKKASKKVAAPANDRKAALQELFGQLNDGGHKVIAYASDIPNTYELRRPCGVTQLDIDTGGGLPAGGMCMLSGPEGAGKSELLLSYMVMHQRLYGDNSMLAWMPLETQFDFKLALRRGLRIRVPSRMVDQWREERFQRGLTDFTKEERESFNQQIGEFVLLGGNTGEEALEAVLACVEKGIFGIIGVDSINGLMPAANVDKDLSEEQKRAAHATLMTKFCNHYIPLTTGLNGVNETNLIFVQQVRSNQQKATAPSYMQAYLKDWATSGAWAMKHYKLVDIIVHTGQTLKKQINGQKVTVGKEVKWELDKGKAGCHDGVTGSIPFYYDGGIDKIGSLIVAGVKLGVIREADAGVEILKPETGEVNEELFAPSLGHLDSMLRQDFDFELRVRMEVMAGAGISCLYR